MKKFIFLADEGSTQTPENEDIENLQVLGWSDGDSLESALSNLNIENPYLKEAGFSKTIAMELKNNNQTFLSL